MCHDYASETKRKTKSFLRIDLNARARVLSVNLCASQLLEPGLRDLPNVLHIYTALDFREVASERLLSAGWAGTAQNAVGEYGAATP